MDVNENVAVSGNDGDVAAAGRQPTLTGCPWHDVNEMLQAAGLRPTRQRMALGWLLFGPRPRIDDNTLVLSLIWPALYVGYSFAHGAVSHWFPP